MFWGWFLGCLVVACGGCFLFFGVCRGFCFVGVVVFGLIFCLVDVVVLFVLFFVCGVGGGSLWACWFCVVCSGVVYGLGGVFVFCCNGVVVGVGYFV